MQTRARFELGDGTRCAVEDGARAQLPVLIQSPRHDAQGAILLSEDGEKCPLHAMRGEGEGDGWGEWW